VTEAEIYQQLTEVFRDVFGRDDMELTPELSAKDVAGCDSYNHDRGRGALRRQIPYA
jgi:acyl carrier protein